jgi:hypothetical protein
MLKGGSFTPDPRLEALKESAAAVAGTCRVAVVAVAASGWRWAGQSGRQGWGVTAVCQCVISSLGAKDPRPCSGEAAAARR